MEYYKRINTVCLMILAVTAITLSLSYTKIVLIPFVFSLFVYAFMSPLIRWLRDKRRLPHILSIFLTLLLFVIILAFFTFLITASLEDFLSSADLYKERIIIFIQSLRISLVNLGIPVAENLVNELKDLPYLSFAKNISSWLFSFVANSTLVIIFVFFLALGERRPYTENHPLVGEIQTKIFRYTSTKLLISIITGMIIGIVMLLFNLELALLFSIIIIFLNFIPNIGSILATLVPIPIIILQFGFSLPFYFIISFSMLVQFVVGNLIEPKLLGDSLDLHPIAILFFLMFWGIVWGVPGLFLAVPMTAIIRMIMGRFEITYFISELLAGRYSQKRPL